MVTGENNDLFTFLADPSCQNVAYIGNPNKPTDFVWTGPSGDVRLERFLVAMGDALSYTTQMFCKPLWSDNPEAGNMCALGLAPERAFRTDGERLVRKDVERRGLTVDPCPSAQ